MAQAEDAELKDLVIEALEKNGSLAKIRALLRANIFLAFEDEYDNIKQNKNLDNILKVPEGLLSLSIVHEFLEYCNLKNTLFVYLSESRHGREYNYEGRNNLAEKLKINNQKPEEPLLITLVKDIMKQFSSNIRIFQHNDKTSEKLEDHYKDNENYSYIMHDSSNSNTSTSSQTQSESSMDEKHKLHMPPHLYNSDTDTSCDSIKDKRRSEYIPSQHIHLATVHPNDENNKVLLDSLQENTNLYSKQCPNVSCYDATPNILLSNISEEKLMNTTGLPIMENVQSDKIPKKEENLSQLSPTSNKTNKSNEDESATLSNISSISLHKDKSCHDKLEVHNNNSSEGSNKSDEGVIDYSNDFSSPLLSKKQKTENNSLPSSLNRDILNYEDKNEPLTSPRQTSQSTQSSVSISDVADLISAKSFSDCKIQTSEDSLKDKKTSPRYESSGDFSESSIPSLSNLSLDIHSD